MQIPHTGKEAIHSLAGSAHSAPNIWEVGLGPAICWKLYFFIFSNILIHRVFNAQIILQIQIGGKLWMVCSFGLLQQIMV